MKLFAVSLLLAVACCGQAFVQNCVNSLNATSANITCSFGSLPTVGNTIVVGYIGDLGTATGCSDNQSNTYTTQLDGNSGGRPWLQIVTAPVTTSSGTFTVTCSHTGTSYQTILATEYTLLASSGIFDASAIGALNQTSPFPCGSITTTNANDLLFATVVNEALLNGGVTFTAGSGFTVVATQGGGFGTEIEGADQGQTVTSTQSGLAVTISSNTNGGHTLCGTVGLKKTSGAAVDNLPWNRIGVVEEVVEIGIVNIALFGLYWFLARLAQAERFRRWLAQLPTIKISWRRPSDTDREQLQRFVNQRTPSTEERQRRYLDALASRKKQS